MDQQARKNAAPQPPIGSIVAYAGNLPAPAGWLVCDGSQEEIDDYSQLAAILGTAWGTADQGYFILPDLRGMFLRGVDKSASGTPTNPPNDPDRDSRVADHTGGNTGNNLGALQYSAVGPHTHGVMSITQTPQHNIYNIDSSVASQYFDTVPSDGPDPGGSDTRPLNAYVWWIIRAL